MDRLLGAGKNLLACPLYPLWRQEKEKKMHTRWTIVLTALTALICYTSFPALAANSKPGADQPAKQDRAAKDGERIIRDLTLVDKTVYDAQRQRLGKVKYVLLEPQDGRANFVVIDMPSKPAHKLIVVPYQALQVSVNPADYHKYIILNRQPDQLREAPKIQNNQWQMLENPQFLNQARNFYQIQYMVARPITQPGTAAAPVAPQTNPTTPQTYPQSGSIDRLPKDLHDFYNE